MPVNREDTIVFIDLETGGLDPLRHPVIQFAAVAVDNSWSEVESFEAKVAFDPASADPGALAANSYDPEEWERVARPSHAVVRSVSGLLRRHVSVSKVSSAGKPYRVARIAAHNASFDAGFLVEWFRRHNEFCPAACYEPLDTLALARWVSLVSPPGPKDHKLGTLCEWMGIPLVGAHDALADVRATVEVARLLSGCVRRYEGRP